MNDKLKPRLFYKRTYHGFEDLYDLQRDTIEAMQDDFNPAAKGIPSEFQGEIIMTLTYIPDEDDLEMSDYSPGIDFTES